MYEFSETIQATDKASVLALIEETVDKLRRIQTEIIDDVPAGAEVPLEILTGLKIEVNRLHEISDEDIR